MYFPKIKLVIISLILFFASSPFALACECKDMGDFAKFSQENIVIRGQVLTLEPQLEHGTDLYESMIVAVKEVIAGSFQHSEIKLNGDNGVSCLSYVDSQKYETRSEHLFILLNQEKEQGLRAAEKFLSN